MRRAWAIRLKSFQLSFMASWPVSVHMLTNSRSPPSWPHLPIFVLMLTLSYSASVLAMPKQHPDIVSSTIPPQHTLSSFLKASNPIQSLPATITLFSKVGTEGVSFTTSIEISKSLNSPNLGLSGVSRSYTQASKP